ncbi:diaminopimelate epimerase [Paenibacillus zeisoli]|uniref:Diaminopimelate epimerase n=1 Tax=Paenibacillus zeisoli TaxID=2496267 RepID=A0A3S1D9L7_9BACL|nr:diaminopimelate epimerase [Paenibacillus zeisoli]RUT35797.1 diaminopimelate epimerase [Paenibacillus zeisoli]
MKQEIDFVKVNPTQNMTILVISSHPMDESIPIASRLMSYDSVHAEQVGFIRKPSKQGADAKLHMAAGEFCGNACMAASTYLAIEKGVQPDTKLDILLESSGSDHLIACQVSKVNDQYACQVTMPLPNQIVQRSIQYEGEDLSIAIVKYDNFFHIVIEVELFSPACRKRAEGLARLLGITLGSNLIGVMLFEPKSNMMAPLIYLPDLDSMVWEKGCGSGTASVGAYLSWKKKSAVTVRIAQPGGTILVNAEYSQHKVTNLIVEGMVGIVAKGKAYIEMGGCEGSANSYPASATLV